VFPDGKFWHPLYTVVAHKPILTIILTLFCMAGGWFTQRFFKVSLTKTCQFKNVKKYVFLGKFISYHLSLGDFFEKSLFHIDLLAFEV
jgi:hypothetical protein